MLFFDCRSRVLGGDKPRSYERNIYISVTIDLFFR